MLFPLPRRLGGFFKAHAPLCLLLLSLIPPARAAWAAPAALPTVGPPTALPVSGKKAKGPAGKAPDGATAEVADLRTLVPYDEHYGVYVSGQKVGWMRSRLWLLPQPVLSTELHAKVSGMGKVSDIELTEERTYAAQSNFSSGLLERITFVQRAATGAVTVNGKRRDSGTMQLDIKAGGSTHTQDIEVTERLGDAMKSADLARGAKIGSTAQAVHFDPSIQKIVRVEHKVVSVQRRNFAGVDTKAVKVISNYPDLGVNEVAWLDSTGKVLESQIGGFFVARLEPPDVAKRLDYTQDLLISAVVRAPRVLVAPQNITRLSLRFEGFGDTLPPSSPRQEVHAEGTSGPRAGKAAGQTAAATPVKGSSSTGKPAEGPGAAAGPGVLLVLSKDPLPRRTLLNKPLGTSAPEVLEALKPTAFIQSDAPELVEAARTAVGSSRDVFAASTKLVGFVYRHIRSEYVPAYSNALEAFQSARGDCTEHSILYVALARAVGIPARVAVGVAYWPPGDGFGWHAWAEIYVAGRWIAVDPTWNQPIADATHVKLADGGPAEQARIVMLLGKLKITEMKSG
jgi:transglutaminase-like putative cysteine protease